MSKIWGGCELKAESTKKKWFSFVQKKNLYCMHENKTTKCIEFMLLYFDYYIYNLLICVPQSVYGVLSKNAFGPFDELVFPFRK